MGKVNRKVVPVLLIILLASAILLLVRAILVFH